MKSDDASVEAEVLTVMAAGTFHVEFFPSITIFRIGRIRISFLQRNNIRFALQIGGIDTSAGGIQKALSTVNPRRFNRMGANEGVIADDYSFIGLNKANPAHVRSKG